MNDNFEHSLVADTPRAGFFLKLVDDRWIEQYRCGRLPLPRAHDYGGSALGDILPPDLAPRTRELACPYECSWMLASYDLRSAVRIGRHEIGRSLSPLWVKIRAKGHPASLWPRNQRSPFIVGTVNDLPGEDEFLTVKDRFDLLIAYAMLHVPLAGKRPSLMESGERDGFDSRNSWIGSRSA